jgi:alginate O-acetyltransferase complex protein AlgI
MLFDTPVYLIFLAALVLVYWRLKHRRQNLFLLGASYFFYGWWDVRFLLLMMGSTAIDFLIARRIGAAAEPAKRRALLTVSLVINFGILAIFKYFNFFADSLSSTLGLMGVTHLSRYVLQIVLPPGISFYTFQEVAYIVDVYKRKIEPADSLLEYALFISLFPHLVAGPIQRPDHLLPQVQRPRALNHEAFFDGCMLIVSGLFRKCVVADQCAIIANAAFEGRFGHNAPAAVIGVVAFAWQIYGDFSGYSDFARGSAQLLGFHFMVNFRQPYLAMSMQDFWRRWHISLSTWLRDYLFIPLGGSRTGKWMTYRNLMFTMLLGGLWHGANWTFVIWGGIHGAALSVERLWIGIALPETERIGMRWVKRIGVFGVVCFAWIFFRAPSLATAAATYRDLARWEWRPTYATALLVLAAVAGIALLLDLRMERHREEYAFQRLPEPQRIVVACTLLIAVIMFSSLESSAFIYFQF